MSDRPTVLVTGSSGRLGRQVVRALHRHANVLAVDRRPLPGAPKDVEPFRIDLRRTAGEDLFRRHAIDAVVHLGIMHDPRVHPDEHHTFNLVGTQHLLEYCSTYGVQKFVFLSSADVYGPRPTNPQFLTEDAPLLGAGSFHEIRDLVAVDMAVQAAFWRHSSLHTVILRPVHIVGTVRNAASNYLRRPRIYTLLGFDPMVQVIHEDDVVRAVCRALRVPERGVFNLAGPPPVPLSTLVRLTGRPTTPLPHPAFGAAMEAMWRLRLTSFPPAELAHIRYTSLVDDGAARARLDYAPAHGVEDIIDTALDRRVVRLFGGEAAGSGAVTPGTAAP